MKWFGIGILLLSSFVTNAQIISTYAGCGTCSLLGDGGPATAALLLDPIKGIFDSNGNYYFTEGTAKRVREINTSGIITTVAGTGSLGTLGDGGPATAAHFVVPSGTIIDTYGNIYIDDVGENRIRVVNASTDTITTVVGNGTGGLLGDGGPATAAEIFGPQDICFDKRGNLYIADAFNYRVRKVNTIGIISTFAGTVFSALGSGDGGLATAAGFSLPMGVVADDTGNIYIADETANTVRKVDTFGMITTVAGNGAAIYVTDGIPATAAQINPIKLAIDDSGNLLIADKYNRRVFKVDNAGIIHCVAGNGVAGFSGDGGPATAAEFNYPSGVAFDACGNLYIAETGAPDSANIRKVTFPGTLTTSASFVYITTSPGDTVCTGTPVAFSASATGAGVSPSYYWYVNGVIVSGTTSNLYTYTPAAGDSVYCSLFTGIPCTTNPTVSSNALHMVVNPIVIPTISISASPSDTVCSGTPVIYTSVVSGGGAVPVYQWLVDGVVAGTLSSLTYTPVSGDAVRCVLTSSAECSTPVADSSNTLHMAVNPTVIPSVSISASPSDTVCTGASVTFIATATNGGTSPAYQWIKNGSLTGIGAATYTYTPADADSVRCILTSDAVCATPPTVSSISVNMVVDTFIEPSIIITGLTTALAGSTVTVTATVANAGSSYTIHWMNQGIEFASTTVPFVTYTKTASIDTITATIVPTGGGCYDSATSVQFIVADSNTSVYLVSQSGLSIYPNPVSETINIVGLETTASYRLFDMVGTVVVQGNLSAGSNSISVHLLASGVYALEIIPLSSGEGRGEVKTITKIIKE